MKAKHINRSMPGWPVEINKSPSRHDRWDKEARLSRIDELASPPSARARSRRHRLAVVRGLSLMWVKLSIAGPARALP
jgi:hypothetical protein